MKKAARFPKPHYQSQWPAGYWQKIVSIFHLLPPSMQEFADEQAGRIDFRFFPTSLLDELEDGQRRFFLERVCGCKGQSVIIYQWALDNGRVNARALRHELTHAICRWLPTPFLDQVLFYAVSRMAQFGEKFVGLASAHQKAAIAPNAAKRYAAMTDIAAVDGFFAKLPVILNQDESNALEARVKSFLVTKAKALSDLATAIGLQQQPWAADGQCLVMAVLQHLSIKNGRQIVYPQGQPDEETFCYLMGADAQLAEQMFNALLPALSPTLVSQQSSHLIVEDDNPPDGEPEVEGGSMDFTL